jgi:hypothetical protein
MTIGYEEQRFLSQTLDSTKDHECTTIVHVIEKIVWSYSSKLYISVIRPRSKRS